MDSSPFLTTTSDERDTDIVDMSMQSVDASRDDNESVLKCVRGLAAGFVGLLYWAMLAASTIGPGTITLMAKGGSDYGLDLSWTVPLASVVAFALCEAVARLQISAGASFGGALFAHYYNVRGSGTGGSVFARVLGSARGTPTVSFVLVFIVVVSMTLLECAQVAGMWAACDYYYQGGEPEYSIFRAAVTFVLCIFVGTILFKGGMDSISKALGLVVFSMTISFGVSAGGVGCSASALLDGFAPRIPDGAAPVALGMVATTAPPINVFLASSLAQGCGVIDMRRGVAFATLVTAVLSLLVVIVGTGDEVSGDETFSLDNLARTLRDSAGSGAEILFLGGLAAASLSSGLTVALGAALACQTLLGGHDAPKDDAGSAARGTRPSISERLSFRDNAADSGQQRGGGGDPWAADSWRFRGVIAGQLLVSFVVVTSGLDTVGIIVMSQVFGGVLLPTLCFCLLVCMNSPRVALGGTDGQQTRLSNAMLIFATTVTSFLAVFSVVPLQGDDANLLVAIAGTFAFATLAASCRVVLAAERTAGAAQHNHLEEEESPNDVGGG